MLFRVRLARVADELDFSDLTDCNKTGPAMSVADGVEIPFAPDPTPEEAARIAIRLSSADADEERARLLVNDTMTATDAFLNETEPRTLAQIEAQVVALSGQFRAMFRLTIGHDDQNGE
jgi:hypothetical protein